MYVIMLISDVKNRHINASNAHSLNCCRKNSDETKVILEFDSTNDIQKNIFIDETWLSLEEIQSIVLDDGWNE